MVEIIPIDTPSLGDRSYLAHDGEVALVVDPQRDLDRVLALADRHRVRITHVFETHVHNDYLTGGLALAKATGAAYHVNADDPVTFPRVPVRDGDAIRVTHAIRVLVLATPGHTFTHLAFVLEVGGMPVGVFTGGSLLYGSVGRPDLLGPTHTPTLARLQLGSARRLAAELPDATPVFPTHGFGSFCSVSQSEASSSTIGQEKRGNPALTRAEHDWVEMLLAGLDAWPAYYAHMGSANLAGPDAPDLSPPAAADVAELRRRVDSGEWVVDLRARTAFAAAHVPGTLSFSLDGSFATYLGWLLPWGTPLTLLGETPEAVAEAQRELTRIGIDRPAAAATGPPERWADAAPLVGLRLASLRELAAARSEPGVVVLDVRRRLEWSDGHVTGAVHIPLHELSDRLGEVPPGEVWVHCHSGYRATLAASLLAAHGRDAVAVDDEFENAAAAGLPLEQSRGGDHVSATIPAHDALPAWRRVLAVVAHPDDESFGLGGLLDAFHDAGAEVSVLCFTHGEASTLRGVPGDLHEVRVAELRAAASLLGVAHVDLRDHPDGGLAPVAEEVLAGEVAAVAGAGRVDGMLVFDTGGVTGHPDHIAATAAAVRAARSLDLPVLGWGISSSVAEALNAEFGSRFRGRQPSEIHLTVRVNRIRQRHAAQAHPSQALPTSALWRRLDLLGDTEGLRWLSIPPSAGPPAGGAECIGRRGRLYPWGYLWIGRVNRDGDSRADQRELRRGDQRQRHGAGRLLGRLVRAVPVVRAGVRAGRGATR